MASKPLPKKRVMRRLRKPDSGDPSPLQQALIELDLAREARNEADQEYKDATAKVMAMMRTKSTSVDLPDGGRLRVTKVTGSRSSLDEGKLAKRIGHVLFRKLCTLKLDDGKLQKAVADGVVSPTVIAMCTEETPNEPYLRITK